MHWEHDTGPDMILSVRPIRLEVAVVLSTGRCVHLEWLNVVRCVVIDEQMVRSDGSAVDKSTVGAQVAIADSVESRSGSLEVVAGQMLKVHSGSVTAFDRHLGASPVDSWKAGWWHNSPPADAEGPGFVTDVHDVLEALAHDCPGAAHVEGE